MNHHRYLPILVSGIDVVAVKVEVSEVSCRAYTSQHAGPDQYLQNLFNSDHDDSSHDRDLLPIHVPPSLKMLYALLVARVCVMTMNEILTSSKGASFDDQGR